MNTSAIESNIGPVVLEAGYELVDVEFRPAKGNSILQVFVDKEGGINFDALASLSSLIGDVLESKDLIKGSYSLEVSSPGVERPLKNISDYIRFKGKMVRLSLYSPINGSKNILVHIQDIEGDVVLFKDDGCNEISLKLNQVAKANLYFEFNNT